MVGCLHQPPSKKVSLFLSRVIFHHVSIQAPILAFRNAVRTHLSHKAAIHKAKQLGCASMVCVTQDTCKGRPIKVPVVIRKMFSYIYLIARQSIYPAYYLLFLEYLSFRRKILQSSYFRSTAWMKLFDNWPVRYILCLQTVYRKHILATRNTFIEVPRSKIECTMEELQPKLVSIPLIEPTFQDRYYWYST